MKKRRDSHDRTRPVTFFVIFLLFFLASMQAKAVNAAGERLTLDEAVRMALHNNHELRAHRYSGTWVWPLPPS